MATDTKDYAELLFKSLFGHETSQRTIFDVEQISYLLAAVSSAQHFMKDFPKVTNFHNQRGVLQHALAACSVPGLTLEFGVASGWSIKLIASTTTDHVHGFDSFEGLPEDWSHFQKAGRYSTSGKIPQGLPDNVKLHIGWFNKTLPHFMRDEAGDLPVRFMHVDSDLYSSAKTILHTLGGKIVPGTVIVFDDYFNYPNWENGEAKAWQEFVAYRHVNFEYLGWASKASSIAVKVLSLSEF